VCLLFFEFCEEIQKLLTRAFPPRTPPHPKLKIWGSSRGNNIALLLRVWVLKKEENTNVLQNSYLCTRIAFRFFLNAFINFGALQAAINVAANALNNRDIHLKSSSIARSTSSRSSVPSRVRTGSYRVSSSSAVRLFFSISASSKSHCVKLMTFLILKFAAPLTCKGHVEIRDYQKLQWTFLNDTSSWSSLRIISSVFVSPE